MEKIIIRYTIIFISLFISSLLFPWWMASVLCFFAGAFLFKTSWAAFVNGFLALSVFWIIIALSKSIPNEHLLSDRVAQLLTVHSWIYLLLITGFLGGLVGGMSAFSGRLASKAVKKID